MTGADRDAGDTLSFNVAAQPSHGTLSGSGAKLTYKPASDATATQQFDAREFDVCLRYFVSGPISAELGFVNRTAKPEFEAQSMGAITAG